MITIAITSFKEPRTIGIAIQSFLNQNPKNFELIVSAPDKETLDAAKKLAHKNKNIKIIKDKGKGKPAALNNIFKIAKGDILILSDGDVYVSKNSVKELLMHFNDKKVGAVTARPVSINDKDALFGFWAHLLTTGFHNLRMYQKEKNKPIIASGYLYALRKNIVKSIPEDILADDAFISLTILNKGYKIEYEPNAEVYVKYPTNLPDWIRQKKRTAGRLYQFKGYFKSLKFSSLKEEILFGAKTIFEIKKIRHIPFYFSLIIMRFYIWFRIFFDFRLWNRSFKKTWERVESTK